MPRIKIEDIKNETEGLGWVLLSSAYKNLNTELQFRCPNGHEVNIPYAIWRANHKCPICEAPKAAFVEHIEPKKKKTYRILALDQATKTTGWAIYDGDTIIKYGLYNCSGETDKRINDTKNWLINMLHIWQPDEVIFEDIQLQEKNNRNWENDDGNAVVNIITYKTLAQLQGVLFDLLFENNITYSTVAPSVWRENCGINGKYRNDKKKSAQIKVQSWFNIEVTNDEADAICIGKYAVDKRNAKFNMIDWS